MESIADHIYIQTYIYFALAHITMNTFRRRQDSGLGLPTVSGNAPKPGRFGFSTRGSPKQRNGSYGGGVGYATDAADGSAASIHVQSPVARAIQKSSPAVKRSYGIILACLVLMYSGYRHVRSQNASVWLTCHKQECHLQVSPRGFTRMASLRIARRQVIRAVPVKTLKDGTFVSSDNIKLNEDWKNRRGPAAKKKGHKNMSSYKGPDENGHYLSYAVLLHDAMPRVKKLNATQDWQLENNNAQEDEREDADLSSVKHFLDATNEPGVYRLILRKFNIQQTKRRVRTMTQKIDSYCKKRRHKLAVKESAPPSWQGILVCILGLIGMCLTMLLGQFWDEPVGGSAGPGARRRPKAVLHPPHHKKKVDDSVFKPQTPARYEVPVGPRPVGGAVRKRA